MNVAGLLRADRRLVAERAAAGMVVVPDEDAISRYLDEDVRAPKLANLLPIRDQLLSPIVDRCTDFAPALQFERLEKIVVATEDLANTFAVLGGRLNLIIADPLTASDVAGAERLRATFQNA